MVGRYIVMNLSAYLIVSLAYSHSSRFALLVAGGGRDGRKDGRAFVRKECKKEVRKEGR